MLSNSLKLFDILIRPILTYGSEMWISDFTIKDKIADTLPFEKIHNRFCKFLIGVHKKSSNFASGLELGRERILKFITCQALKFSERLNKLPATHFMKLTNPSIIKVTEAGILLSRILCIN